MSDINWPATVLAAFVGGAASLGVGYLTFLNTDRSHDLRMVEVSLSILRGESDAEKSTMARTFALRALEKYSRVELTDEEFATWVSVGTVPFKATNVAWDNRTPILWCATSEGCEFELDPAINALLKSYGIEAFGAAASSPNAVPSDK